MREIHVVLSDKKSRNQRLFETIERMVKLAALVAVPVAVSCIGNSYNRSVKEAELTHSYIESCITVLLSENSTKEELEWALDLLNTELPIGNQITEDSIEKIVEQKTNGNRKPEPTSTGEGN